MKFRLSKRLNFLLEQATRGPEFWDVGCDHGQLGLQALATEKSEKVFLIDASPEAIQNLEAKLQSPKMVEWWRANQHKVNLQCGPGENVVRRVNGTLSIAGMGGETMIDILNSLESADKVVLNPFSHFEQLEDWLEQRSIQKNTSTVEDRGIVYRVYSFENYAARV